MRMLLFFLLSTMFLGACNQAPELTIPGEKPDAQEAEELLALIIRLHGEMPEKANHNTKFDTVFDEHYNRQLAAHSIDRVYREPSTDEIFVVVSRIAPSIGIKRVSTGIRLKISNDKITFYEEVFRTWRLPEDILLPRADTLFALMVNGEDLTPYYTASKADQFIEFPDEHTWFDTLERRWVSDLEDPVRKLKEEFSKEWEAKK